MKLNIIVNFVNCFLLFKFKIIYLFNLANLRKFPKLLDSSPSALRRLNNKGELLGINTSNRNLLSLEDITDVRRKWYIQPAFSVEFISYYIGSLTCSFFTKCLRISNLD